ncbi:MAG TPA: hypothetical protein VIW25_12385 [Nitrososphaeraceae archaeon]
MIEKNEKLRELRKNNGSNKEEIERLMTELETLQSLFDNYNLGMNYFRRARGGRSGLRE